MAIRMRRGIEEDFDPEKMVPGEWAVSTDTRYVRMCFATGIVLRMATYEAFEADMQEIQNILATCQDIQKAVEKFEGLAEQHASTAQSYSIESKSWSDSAKSYSEEATRQANLAKMYAENASAVTDVQIATENRAGIIKGGDNHITEDGTLTLTKQTTGKTLDNSCGGGIKVNEIGGKSEQVTTTGKNLFQIKCATQNTNGISIADNGNQSFSASGTATQDTSFELSNIENIKDLFLNGFTGILSLTNAVYDQNKCNMSIGYKEGNSEVVKYMRPGIPSTIPSGSIVINTNLYIPSGATVNLSNVKVQLELGEEITTWESYTGGKASPRPDYPQEIKAVTGKNLLDCRGLTEQTHNSVTYSPIYDENGNLLYVEANGTASADSTYTLKEGYLVTEESILSGCPSGGSNSTFFLVVGGSGYDYGQGHNTSVSSVARFIGIGIKSGYTANKLRFYPMIRPASITDNTYVPYGCLRVKTSGIQLFDANKLLDVNNNTTHEVLENGYSITVTGGTRTAYSNAQYYMDDEDISRFLGKTVYLKADSFTSEQSPSLFAVNLGIHTDDEKHNYVGLSNEVLMKEITIPKNTIRLSMHVYSNNIASALSADNTVTVKGLRLSFIEDAKWEPYQEKAITLSNPITLNGHNGVQDRIVRKDGVWSVERKFEKELFETSNSVSMNEFEDGNLLIYSLKNNPLIDATNRMLICESAIGVSLDERNMDTSSYRCYIDNNGKAIFRSPEGIAITKNEFDELLNGTVMVYRLKKPTFEPLPTADQIALNSLASFDGVTYLYFDSEIEPTSLVEYGTSKVGGYTLDAWNKAENNRIRMEEVTMAMLSLNQE